MNTESYENFFTHFSNKTKLKIVLSLLTKPLSVNEIVKKTNEEQSKISHNLKTLTNCHIIEFKQNGKKRIYSLNKKTAIPLLKLVKKHTAQNCDHSCNKCMEAC